jgi:serine/threonine-protein kinase
MATVYRAKDRRLGREVAVKVLHRHLRESPELEARFESEARTVAKLKHPNIVEVHDVSEPDEPERYLVVELVRGITLRELLKRNGALPSEVAAEIVSEIASALEHAHREGVIHRDVKPENVLLDDASLPAAEEPSAGDVEELDRARVKLADFGIAKLLDAQGVTSTGQVLGSPAHMAPEQIEGKPVDCRADVFSLGVLFFECLIGALPFSGNNPAQVLRNVLDGNFTAPCRLQPEVGERWSRIVVRALQREPEDRFQSVTEFARAVRAELTALGFTRCRRDIAEFLRSPEVYRATYQARIVESLVKDGAEARLQKDVPRASDQLGRALALKPGDAALLRHVSGLRRRRRLSRVLALAGVVGVGAALVAAAVHYWPQPAAGSALRPPEPTRSAGSSAQVPVPPPAPSAELLGGPETLQEKRKRRVRSNPQTVEISDQTREVSVRVTGATGGSVRIDGVERPWFGVTHQLTLGPHLFEFIPPNDDCCDAAQQRVEVQAGDGAQLVVGRIGFKAAGLHVRSSSSRGFRLSCPTLFPGELPLPGERSVAMTQLEVTGSCTIANSEEGSATRSKVVILRAGNTTALPWP